METPNTEIPSSSSSSAIQPTPAPFALILSPSMRKSSASKLDYLFENDSQARPKKISSGRKLKQQLRDGHKNIGTLGQPSGKFDYIVKYTPPSRITEPIVPTGWDDDTDDHLRRPPPPSLPTASPVLPCSRQTQKYLQKQEQQFPTPCNLTFLERLESQIQRTHLELLRLASTTSFLNILFAEKETEMKFLQTQLTALKTQAHTGFSMPSTMPWQFVTIPKEEQPLPTVPQREDHVLQLKKLIDQDDALRKLKGKQKGTESTSSQMMVQLQQLNISSEEESVPEDSDWSSNVSEIEEPTSP
ncbi:hypothetical protein TIFTF001_013901 [Ficus carica]|uniref:Uncharacterized protein n=1 Tax=Ficus carica TaxID=3494 RepID=A0AA88DIC6_FICCA|nr:hypothetical protein TIFTF001_013901 [Ficus carica]